ncbi:MAG: cryptochrome/photolyase family protein [Gammaproteobacteria bacterium]
MTVLVPLLGNQLFPQHYFEPLRGARVLMVEDRELCSYVPHHQHKLVLVLAAMRAHAGMLVRAGFDVDYRRLDDTHNRGLWAAIEEHLTSVPQPRLRYFTFVGRRVRERLHGLARRCGAALEEIENPMFLTSLAEFDAHLSRGRKPFLARFYRQVRADRGVLLEADGTPRGGRWSFDGDNRRPLPAALIPPRWPDGIADAHVGDCITLVSREFPAHPGTAADFAWPTTRAAALGYLERFLSDCLPLFGTYQDALSARSDGLYHSLLSPVLNIGLITPHEVLARVLEHAARHDIPLNSLEGFVRQLLGWREFVRGIHERFGAEQARTNFWGHTRAPAPSWWDASTGIPPLDDAIRLALKRGWNHHIQRLMVVGNLMLLAGIAPRPAYRWFMALYVDAYGWVMEPNVYGMALYSDGGLFATKPYICASNYLLRMSDYARGPWCDTVDGLYWSFVQRHLAFFERQPRLRVMTATLARMDAARRERIFGLAQTFRETHTRPFDRECALGG